MFLDATYGKARVNRRVVSRAVVIATGVAAGGRWEVLGCDLGDSENEVFWTDFLRGLTNAIGTVLTGAGWQRCRVHFSPNVLARVTKRQAAGHWRTTWSTNPLERLNGIRPIDIHLAATCAGGDRC